MEGVSRVRRRVEVDLSLPGEAALGVAADIFIPSRPPGRTALLLCCLPGGGLGRGYYDLRAAGEARGARPADHLSFAADLVSRGFPVAIIDPLGAGDSDRPSNGFELTPDVLAAAHASAVERIRLDLMHGTLLPSVAPIPELRSVGVGHSLGALLTVMQQVRAPQHAALVLLGFGAGGLPAALSAEEAGFADDPAGARENLVRLARARSSDPYPQVVRSAQARAIFAGETAEPLAVEALNTVRTRLLLTAGLFSMIPGSSAPECARVEVPVFLAVGDRDIAGPPHQIPASFTASRDVTLVVLPETGHCHFLFVSRRLLYDRIAHWLHFLLRDPT